MKSSCLTKDHRILCRQVRVKGGRIQARLFTASLFTHVKEKAGEESAKKDGVGVGVGFASKVSKKNIAGPILYPVKSSVLRWRPVPSRFYPHVEHRIKLREAEGSE